MTEDKAVANLLADHYQAGRKEALQDVEKIIDKIIKASKDADLDIILDNLKQKLHSLEEKQ